MNTEIELECYAVGANRQACASTVEIEQAILLDGMIPRRDETRDRTGGLIGKGDVLAALICSAR